MTQTLDRHLGLFDRPGQDFTTTKLALGINTFHNELIHEVDDVIFDNHKLKKGNLDLIVKDFLSLFCVEIV